MQYFLVDFRILGPLEVWEGGQRLPLGGVKQRAVLAILLLEANRVVSTERLIELVWGEDPPETVGNTLQVAISQLRKVLEPGHAPGDPYGVLVSQKPGYMIRLTPDELDLGRFEQLRVGAREAMSGGDPESGADQLRAALALWRGIPFADLANESYVIAEANRLNDIRLQALEDRIEADLALGRHRELVGELEEIVAEYPLRERFRAQLMLALYRSGRQAEASDVFHKTRTHLVEELGIEPGSELQRLLTAILQQDPKLDLSTSPSRQTNSNLPLQLTSFVGRADEVAQVKRLISSSRLVTITGTGGMGKTRLAIEVARQLDDVFPDGVWLAELAPVAAGELVPQTVALSLGIREQAAGAVVEGLIAHLQKRRTLLILDNCEHVIDASASLAEGLLRNCADLRVLATSREELRIEGEAAWQVPPLEAPSVSESQAGVIVEDYPAVELFLDRARTAVGPLEVSDDTKHAVALICQRLDGIPLAIELAAGKLRILSLQQIADRLSNRLHLLTGGRRTAISRHQTLRAAIDWSYELLSDAQRVLFRRLSVFVGSFSLEAAEAIGSNGGGPANDLLELLGELVSKSMVSVERRGATHRYRILESLREYGWARLEQDSELGQVRDRHRQWFLALVERAEFRGPLQTAWFDRIEMEHDDLRAALSWSLDENDAESSLRFGAAVGYFWRQRGFASEGLNWLERALRLPSEFVPARGRALLWASALAMEVGDYARAQQFGDACISMLETVGDDWGLGFAKHILGFVAFRQDDLALAAEFLAEGAAAFQKAGQKWGIALGLHSLGLLYWAQSQYDEALNAANEALILFRDTGDEERVASSLSLVGKVQLTIGNFQLARRVIEECATYFERLGAKQSLAATHNDLGTIYRCLGDLDRARASLTTSVAEYRRVGSRQGVAYALMELGIATTLQGRLTEALPAIRESLNEFMRLSDKLGMSRAIEALAATEVGTRPNHAATLLGVADALRQSSGLGLESYEIPWHDSIASSVRQALGQDRYDAALSGGRLRPLEEVLVPWLDLDLLIHAGAKPALSGLGSSDANRGSDRG